jgi:hypothetical protein
MNYTVNRLIISDVREKNSEHVLINATKVYKESRRYIREWKIILRAKYIEHMISSSNSNDKPPH